MTTKNPFTSRSSIGGLAGRPRPATSATTVTSIWARAVANRARDIPCGRKRTTMLPITPTATTPTYIMLDGSPSAPITPTPAATQPKMSAVASAMPTADRYKVRPVLFPAFIVSCVLPAAGTGAVSARAAPSGRLLRGLASGPMTRGRDPAPVAASRTESRSQQRGIRIGEVSPAFRSRRAWFPPNEGLIRTSASRCYGLGSGLRNRGPCPRPGSPLLRPAPRRRGLNCGSTPSARLRA